MLPIDEQRRLAEVLWAVYHTMEAYKRLIAATDDLVKSKFELEQALVRLIATFPHLPF